MKQNYFLFSRSGAETAQREQKDLSNLPSRWGWKRTPFSYASGYSYTC